MLLQLNYTRKKIERQMCECCNVEKKKMSNMSRQANHSNKAWKALPTLSESSVAALPLPVSTAGVGIEKKQRKGQTRSKQSLDGVQAYRAC